MNFSQPNLLALVIALPLGLAVLLLQFVRRRRKVARALGEARLIARLGGGDLQRLPLARLALLLPAAALLGVAAAGPHWGIKAVEGESRGLNVVLALDISKSMLARDVTPNRLERERLLARRLLRDLAQERVGMVVFAGRAYILAPLTSDQGALQLFVDALDPEIVSQGGSSLAAAVTLAADLARGPQGAAGERAVVLVTDGEALESEDEILQAAERAGRSGVKVFTVGLGTTRGAPVPELEPDTRRIIGYKRDPYGATVISRSNPELLGKIAGATGGKSYDLSRSGSTEDLVRQLRKLQRTPGSTEAGVEPRDQTPWFVALALLLLAVDFVISKRRIVTANSRGGFAQRAAIIVLFTFTFGTGFAIGELERGNRYYRSGKYVEAVREYEKAITAGDDSPELRYNLGTALIQLGRYEDAERHLRLALREMRPELRQRAFYNLGSRYLEHARKSDDQQSARQLLDGAVESYKQALRLEPQDMNAKWNLELALREKEKQSKTPSGGADEQEPPGSEQQSQAPSAGAGAGSSSQSQGGQGQQQGRNVEQRPMSQEQADRILSAVEQDERQLTREKLRKGERRTPVARDW
jgi:Ca-activated chloride channel family protein